MKRRKMLIAIALITMMLLNCVLPIVQVEAAIEKTTMTFNTPLYEGLKSYFQENGIKAVYDDIHHSIKVANSVVEGITEISLKEKGIKDITGLDAFSNVERLILSANDLSEDSNLAILNNFEKLNYLDISSNQIKDVSEIEDLIFKLLEIDTNAVNLSSQAAKLSVDIELNAEEQVLTAEAELPQILKYAGIAKNGGIENQGIIKAEWIKADSERSKNNSFAPMLDRSSVQNPVIDDNNFEIVVGKEEGNSFTQYGGLLKVEIYIKDTNLTYNPNPASKNILKDSKFTIYYSVHTEDTESIMLNDGNLYYAIKDQLKEDQNINKELLSYRYHLTELGDVHYVDYDIRGTNGNYQLCLNDNAIYNIINYGKENEFITYGGANDPNKRTDYEYIEIPSMDENGVITYTRKARVPSLNGDCEDLYIDAYDEPFIFLIDDNVLINKITSLILNDKQITDLSGLEKFVGLKSNLNLSFNYIDTLKTIYELQFNKDYVTKQLQEKYTNRLNAMANTKDIIQDAYEEFDEILKEIAEEIKNIKVLFDQINNVYAAKNPQSEKIAEKIVEMMNGIEEKINQEIDILLNDPKEGINPNISKLYEKLGAMYGIFNDEYKLINLLIPELNYQNEEDEKLANEKLNTLKGVQELVIAQVERISRLEEENALSDLEKDLIKEAFNLSLSEEEENPYSAALEEIVKYYQEINQSRYEWKKIITKFQEIAIYSNAVNYCLLYRMNNKVPSNECLVKEYLLKQIQEYIYEGIDTKTLEAIYNENASELYDSNIYNIFKTYVDEVESYCNGDYIKVKNIYLEYEMESNEHFDAIGVYKDILLKEKLENDDINDNLFFFNQLMTLANKFTAIADVERYLRLPDLKVLDVRNNNISTLGEIEIDLPGSEEETEEVEDENTVNPDNTVDTENTENPENSENPDEEKEEIDTTYGLDCLKNLKEFYVGHNFVTGDISCIDWTKLNLLKRLDLSYNFIEDILPLQVLTNLRSLDVSDNLLSGAFNLSLNNMKKLQDLNLAGNKYEDIGKILIEFETKAGGDITSYFAREDTLNLDLSRQKLEIILDEPIKHNSDVKVTQIDLPPIFAQIEYIDAQRAAFGTTSSKGSIDAKGGVAYVPVNEIGDYEGKVKVIAKNGYPEDVTTSIGINTECTIKYSVKGIEVTEVIINEEIDSVERGTSQNFTATVEGVDVPDLTVEWSIEGANSENTYIDEETGVLVVAADETAEEITIFATSNYDDTVEATKVIKLFTKVVSEVQIKEEDMSIERGKEVKFTAEVLGENLTDADKTISWTVSGTENENTVISEDGVLTIAVDEVAETLTVTATSNYDNTKQDTLDISLFTKVVNEVRIKEQEVAVEKGKSATFTAEVIGENLEDADKTISWTVSGTENKNTVISEDGVLTVAADEVAETLTVTATSVYDNTKSATSIVTPFVKSVTKVVVSDDQRVEPGNTLTFTANVEGQYLEAKDKEVTWTLYGNTTSPYTFINPITGELTIPADETAETLIVMATSKFDNTKFDRAEVKIIIINDIVVEAPNDRVNNGNQITLTAKVEGQNLSDLEKEVTWSISGAKSTNTKISAVGLLEIAEDETADKILVTATSKVKPGIKGTKEMKIEIPLPELGYDLDENDETLIVGVSPTTKASDFKAKLVTDEDYAVAIKRNGEVISDTTNVATGDIVVITFNGAVVETFEIVVKGDVNSDGIADALDSSLIKAHRARITKLTGIYYQAADIDADGEIAVKDVRLLLYHRARIEGFEL